jgi:hypothetical protein
VTDFKAHTLYFLDSITLFTNIPWRWHWSTETWRSNNHNCILLKQCILLVNKVTLSVTEFKCWNGRLGNISISQACKMNQLMRKIDFHCRCILLSNEKYEDAVGKNGVNEGTAGVCPYVSCGQNAALVCPYVSCGQNAAFVCPYVSCGQNAAFVCPYVSCGQNAALVCPYVSCGQNAALVCPYVSCGQNAALVCPIPVVFLDNLPFRMCRKLLFHTKILLNQIPQSVTFPLIESVCSHTWDVQTDTADELFLKLNELRNQ